MILAIIPLIPAAYVAGGVIVGGIVAWARSRSKTKEKK